MTRASIVPLEAPPEVHVSDPGRALRAPSALTLRVRERLSRERRAARFVLMQRQLQTLSQVALVLPLLNDEDLIWDEFLDDDAKRIRGILRQLSPLAREARQLERERAELRRLLDEHTMVTKALTRAVEEVARGVDIYEAKLRRWRTLARVHFRPWNDDRVQRELNAAYCEMDSYLSSECSFTSSLSFMGWHATRIIDPTSSRVQFSIHKTFRGFDLDRHVATCWRFYTDAALCAQVLLAGRARVSLDILQQISPTACLVHGVESHDDTDYTVHRVYLLAVLANGNRTVQFMRSVPVPEMQLALSRPDELWSHGFFWICWDVLDGSKPRVSTDYEEHFGGTVLVKDVAFLTTWFALVRAVLRAVAASTGRPLLSF